MEIRVIHNVCKKSLWSLLISIQISLPNLLGQEVDDFLNQAQSLVATHQYTSAVSVLEAGLERHPGSPELMMQLGSLLVSLGQFAEGDRMLEAALEKAPFHPEALKDQARARFNQGDLAAAVKLLRKSLWYRPDDAETHYRLAFTLFVQADDKGALNHARKAVETDPLASHYRRFFSLLLSVAGEGEDSFDQLRMALKLDPKNPQTLYRLSRAEKGRGNLGQSIEYAELAALEDPDNPLYLNELVSLYERAGDQHLAEEFRNRARGLETAHERFLQALQLSRDGRLDEAVSVLEKNAGDQPGLAASALLLADLYARQGAEDRALRMYAEVMEVDPSQPRAREESAWIHVRRGSVEAALDMLKGSNQPGFARTFLEGYRQFLEADWSGALEKFREVQVAYPLTPALLQLIAVCLAELDRTGEALSQLAKAAELQPNDRRILSQRREIEFDAAVKAMDRRDWRKAIAILQNLTEQDRDNALYLFHLGYSRQQLGKLVEAAQAYSRGLSLSPTADWARINLATSLYLLRRYSEALPEWEKIIRDDPKPDYLLQLGLCYSHLKRDPEAEVTFARALRGDPGNPELLYNLGITRLRLLKTEEAWGLIKRAALKGYPPAVEMVRKARQ